uniref:VCBS repeat-containing protein n=1 Tax=candidate division WOR-3 bacterium TaxID=2052148 RepID=A0A7C4GG83_UNCW3
MKRITLLAAVAAAALAQVPLPSSPNWTSQDTDYATGGAFADINGDGWLDLCNSNGNDMAYDHNAVYLNSGGALEPVASWRSADNGYFGHCYSGDVNNDGLPDLCVAYLGSGIQGDQKARIYRNSGSSLETTPFWKAADRHASFDCCLGDFDLDGDLDLAIAAGDAYTSNGDSACIYRNNSGVFDTLPFWSAGDSVPSDAIRFCDIDDDGDLDLFVGQRRKVSMYRNNSGTLATTPSWVARRRVGWVLRLEFGDYDADGRLDLAVACNGQLGDSNAVLVYHNDAGQLDTLPSRVLFRRFGSTRYTSTVAWADLNGDGYPELIAGGWWMPLVVFPNDSGTIDTTYRWSWPSNPASFVGEAIIAADVDNSHLETRVDSFIADGSRRLFRLSTRPIQRLITLTVNGTPVPPSHFCLDPLLGYISFASTPDPGSTIAASFNFTRFHDICVTNWDRLTGSRLFLNTSASPVAESPGRVPMPALPFSLVTRHSPLLLPNLPLPVALLDASGRRVLTLAPGLNDLSSIRPGVYFVTTGTLRSRIVVVGD